MAKQVGETRKKLLKARRSAAACACQLALDGVSGSGAAYVNTKVHSRSLVGYPVACLPELNVFCIWTPIGLHARPKRTPFPPVPAAMPGPRGAPVRVDR
jgi:hypothetical protein